MPKPLLAAVAVLTLGVLCLTLQPGIAAPSGVPSPGNLGEQTPKHPVLNVPPAPILSPQEELRTIRVPKGFHLELVAAEPQVEDPIALSFDADGRMLVVEMRGYMTAFDGPEEAQPLGRIRLLESTKRDGKYDKATIFTDGLVMPRAVAACKDGALVAETPNLWFCKDTDGDGKADVKKLVFDDFGLKAPRAGEIANPEHNANGLMYNIDNWYYGPKVYRLRPGHVADTWVKEGPPGNGQWGMSHDDIGRLFSNGNSSYLHVDLLPANMLIRNPFFESKAGLNARVYDSNATYPARVNPGVNRGYREGQLRPDGRLATCTAACAPTIYRGDNYPPEYRGDAFVCEPTGNLIAHFKISEQGLTLKGVNQHPGDLDFITATDERFRPVNMTTGPDGCLYIVDLYRGIIQHRIYLTAYLKDQAMQRGLQNGIHKGRIWRLVADGTKPVMPPKMSTMKAVELVGLLSHPNGTVRDTAQRVLVERSENAAVNPLKDLAGAGSEKGLGPLHALWTLHGMGKLDSEAVSDALDHKDPRVRAAAVRLAGELWNKEGGASLLEKVVALAGDKDPQVQVNLVMALSTSPRPEAMKVVADLLKKDSRDLLMRDAAISGLGGREVEFFEYILKDGDWAKGDKPRAELLAALAKCVVAGRSNDRITKLLDMAGTLPPSDWRQFAVLDGAADALPRSAGGQLNVKPVRLKEEPKGVVAMSKISDPEIRHALDDALSVLTWTGKPGDKPSNVPPLTADQEKRFEAGKALYQTTCGVCHQPSGLGMEGTAPPLFGSDWVLGPKERTIRIALHGLKGPVVVNKRTFDLEMPQHTALDDEQLASLLTYVRREWGHEATAVEPADIAAARKATATRSEAYSAQELASLK